MNEKEDSVPPKEPHSNVVAHLKFIGCVREGQIINVSNKTLSRLGLWTSFWRSLSPLDSRQQTLAYIEGTVRAGLELAEKYRKEGFQDGERYKRLLLKNLLRDFEQVLRALSHLARTYNDPMFASNIETIREEIQAKILGYQIAFEQEDDEA